MSERIGKFLKVKSFGSAWAIDSLRGEPLGDVVYLKAWKQFVFRPDAGAEFSFDCLEDLAAFLKRCNAEAK